jgi:hypothetical protein
MGSNGFPELKEYRDKCKVLKRALKAVVSSVDNIRRR